MAHGDRPGDLYDDDWGPDDGWGDEPPGDEPPVDEPPDDGGWGADPPARQGGIRLLIGIAALLLGIGLVAALQKATDDDDPDTDEVATDESTTSSSRRTTTSGPLGLPGDPTSTVTTDGSSGSTSSTARASSTTRRPATTTTATDDEPNEPACASAGGGPATPVEADWAERWQTMPRPNDPATVSICVDDVTPAVGQRITLSIRGDDPDAIFPSTECGVFITWDGPHASFCRDFVIAWEDPRPTPKEEPGHVLQYHAHTYDTPGTKTITGSVWSAEYDGYTSPYSSRAIATLQIQVHA
ncbi:MAG TPA: hypothetical protein VJ804_04405 [Acidimicrobiales bacterium]|nr:hypothetical protein [Acidimicrobiales bacterium]